MNHYIQSDEDYNLDTTCRTCTCNYPNQSLIPIFYKNSDNITPIDLIKPFFTKHFKISEFDNFPKNVCSNCYGNFSILKEFLTECEKSEKNFKLFFNNEINQDKTKKNLNTDIKDLTDKEFLQNTNSIVSPLIELQEIKLEEWNTEKIDSSDDIVNLKIEYLDEEVPNDYENSIDNLDEKIEIICNENNDSNDVFFQLENLQSDHSDSQDSESPKDKSKKKAQECKICNKFFFKNFEKHFDCHRPVIFSQCTICDKIVENLDAHKRNKHLMKFKCKHCEEEFDCARKHTIHVYKVHEKPKYICNICGKRFIFSYILSQHKRNVHATETNAICEICGKTFTNPTILAGHRSTHTIERKINKDDKNSVEIPSEANSFQCPFCSLSFRNLFGLQNHSRSHNKLKNSESYRHVCEYCNQRFNRSDHLQIHLALVHLNNLPYECTICSKRFVKQYVLNQHIRKKHVETSHQCPYCDKVYAFRVSRTRHIRIHHLKEKRFKCDICGEAFVASEHCKKHMEKHTIQEEQDTVQRIYEEILEKQEP